MTDPRPTMEFHISRTARDRYGIDAPWFSLTGNVVLADLAATRRFAQRMNDVRGAARDPGRTVQAGSLHAMGLIDEILHYVAALYREQRAADAMARALEFLEARLGRTELDIALRRFADAFPPLAVYRGDSLDRRLPRGRDQRRFAPRDRARRADDALARERQPGVRPFQELFDDAELERARRIRRS